MSENPRMQAIPSSPALTGLAPVVSANTVVLVLGSFPGARSLALQQYYAHPQNQFWKILQAIWPTDPLPDVTGHDANDMLERYAQRNQWLLDHGLGVWDVYAACEREGSLDSAIRDAVVNDFGALRLPRLKAIAHNGAESFRHSRHVVAALSAAGRPQNEAPAFYRLPSTSPANASWTFERKLEAWRHVMTQHGLA
jgi:hypoxanthine-DNA glycosylase